MGEVRLVPIGEVKQTVEVDLRKTLYVYRRLVEDGVVGKPIVVERSSMAVLKGCEVLEALNLLSAEKVPVFEVDSSEVKLRSLQPGLKPITLEDIVKAGVEGPMLPEGSFEVFIEAPDVNFSVEDLQPKAKFDRNALRVYGDTLELLHRGWPTPLVRLRAFSSESRVVWAKLESYNPYSNSIKDRIGWSMVMDAIERRRFDNILYEATSTNTGIALAAIANILGRRAKLFIPRTIQKASDTLLRILGAEVVRMPVSLTVEAIEDVDSRARADGAVHLNQFENDANFKVHLKYTAREIDLQLTAIGAKPSYIIGGLGTSGHMSAISFYFKSRYGDEVKIVGVQPGPDEVIPGIRRIETGMKWVHWSIFDRIVDVTREEAIQGSIEVARREGLLIGLSSGAVFHVFKEIAGEEGVYVLIFPDSGYKYVEQFEEYFTGSCNLESEAGDI